ncbi:MAG TPA: hypothetical protein VIE16_13130 [Phenylobacterium sp.]|jgi:hypothetical protein
MERDLSTPVFGEEQQHAVSWSAIFAGAVTSLALAFVLTALAAGFGMKLAQPWPGGHPQAADFTPTVGAWLIVVQVLASALGGYLAGRLRTKWTNVHGHEVYFRDTAHGLVAWALSTVGGVLLVAGVLSQSTGAAAAMAAIDPAREAGLAGQASLFMGVGMLLAAFTASVAAAIGGLRRDEMHATFWNEHAQRHARP